MKIRPNPFFPKSINELAHALGVYWRELALFINGLLPDQSGNSGKYLTTDGTNASWATVSGGACDVCVMSPGCVSNYAIGDGTIATAESDGCNNVGIGDNALGSLTTGDENIAIGVDSLQAVTDTGWNIGIGAYSMYSTTGNNNVAIGGMAMYTNTTGYSNVAIGGEALYSQTGANGNVGIGITAGYLTTGANNCIVGTTALYANTTGKQNTCIGTDAGLAQETSDNNVYLGYRAGYTGGPIGAGNTIIGANTPSLGSGITNNIYLVSGGATRARFDGTSWIFTGGVDTNGDAIIDSSSVGLVLLDTAGHYWRVTISTAGALTTTDLGTTKP